MEARTFYRTDVTIVGMIALGLLGFAFSAGLAAARAPCCCPGIAASPRCADDRRAAARDRALGVAGTLAFLAIWELAARAGPASALFPPPTPAPSPRR